MRPPSPTVTTSPTLVDDDAAAAIHLRGGGQVDAGELSRLTLQLTTPMSSGRSYEATGTRWRRDRSMSARRGTGSSRRPAHPPQWTPEKPENTRRVEPKPFRRWRFAPRKPTDAGRCGRRSRIRNGARRQRLARSAGLGRARRESLPPPIPAVNYFA